MSKVISPGLPFLWGPTQAEMLDRMASKDSLLPPPVYQQRLETTE